MILGKLPQKCSVPKRHVIAFMIFIGYSNITFLHTNISMAVVEMTTLKNISTPQGSFELRAEFNWTSQQKSLILSSYSYGRLLSPIGGLLAGKLGGSTVGSIGNLVMAIITFSSPFIFSNDVTLFVIIYVIFGAFEATTIAGIPQIILRWSPPNERARFISMGEIGFNFGAIVSFAVSGWILKQYNWQVLFYSSGLVSFVWFWIWFIVVKNDPSQDKSLSEIELKYIQDRVECTNVDEKLVYPWKQILCCKLLWLSGFAEFAIMCGYIFTSVHLPQYIKDTQHIDITQIGITSTLPQICAAISMPISGIVGDYIRSHNYLSVTNVHRLFAGISLLSATFFYGVVTIWPNFILDIVALSLFQFFTGLIVIDITVLFLDVSPKYTAFMISIVNMFAISAGVVVPLAIGRIVTSQSLSQWKICFEILTSMYLCAALLYIKFVSGDRLSWADYNSNEECTNQTTSTENDD